MLLPGDGIGSLHLRLHSLTLRFAPVHSFRLRFRSPMPEERGAGNDEGTYRNPSPRPPPAVISGRGSRSNALELLPIVGIQPLLAALTTLSVCLGSTITESGWNAAAEDGCNTPSASSSPARSAPVRITPRSCQLSVTTGEAATAPDVGHGSCRAASRHSSPASPPAHPIKSRYA